MYINLIQKVQEIEMYRIYLQNREKMYYPSKKNNIQMESEFVMQTFP